MPAQIRILVTIETDPTRYHGEHAAAPRLAGSTEGEQVLAHLAADLARILPETSRCRLTMPGALYDQTQVLRPGFPVHAALERWRRSAAGGRQAPQGVIGAEHGRMPDRDLQPDPEIPPGLLQNLPLLVSGESELIGTLAESMEHLFLEQGQLSAHSAQGLEANFGIGVTHARFMTVTDLLAMLQLQLEHFGFLPLWELLDAALQAAVGPLQVAGERGQHFRFANGVVHCRFETFDFWAQQGGGKALDGGAASLGAAYADWTREYRQYLATLQAHAVAVVQYLAGSGEPLEASFLVEESAVEPPAAAAEVTEHGSAELGALAVTVVSAGRQYNYYPLSPAGLNELHASLRARGLGPAGFSFPGRLLCDPDQRHLIPDMANPAND